MKSMTIIKRIICGKEVFLFNDLLEDIKRLCEANSGTNTRTLKRKIIDTFPQENSFYSNGKYFIVHSSDVNHCQ